MRAVRLLDSSALTRNVLVHACDTKPPIPLAVCPRSARCPLPGPCHEQLRKEVDQSRKALRSIRNQLLAVQSRLAAQQQANPSAAAAVKQALTSRHHDIKDSHQLLRDSNFQPTMALYNVYEEKLTALREERKKADGLLAKAERMLNIARIDSLHSAKTKKAALEELKYATSKLRRYQDLRSKSQHCQMDAASAPYPSTPNSHSLFPCALADPAAWCHVIQIQCSAR